MEAGHISISVHTITLRLSYRNLRPILYTWLRAHAVEASALWRHTNKDYHVITAQVSRPETRRYAVSELVLEAWQWPLFCQPQCLVVESSWRDVRSPLFEILRFCEKQVNRIFGTEEHDEVTFSSWTKFLFASIMNYS